MTDVLDIHPLDWHSIGSCIFAAAIIGFERQCNGKPIGVRTSCLVCLGTYIFVAMGHSHLSQTSDPSRIVGQVVTGVGFLGAGVMFSRGGVVVGVTSAAAIWILAAIGVTVGQGYAWLGIRLAVLTTLLLVGLDVLEKRSGFLQRGAHRRMRKHPRKTSEIRET